MAIEKLSEIVGSDAARTAQESAWAVRRLGECYELVRQMAAPGDTDSLAGRRLSRLTEATQNLPQADLATSDKTFQARLSELRSDMFSEFLSSSDSRTQRQSAVLALPDCAEKHYLLALLALRNDSGNQGCHTALQHLDRALLAAPGHVIYRTLAEVILDATRRRQAGGV